MTMAETTSFWDSGEFIAIANGLQVSHPPGAPFYMLVGRFFAMFAPLFGAFTPEPIAFAVALVSVLSSALTILVTHLIIVRLVRIWKGHPRAWGGADRVAANAGGAIGALTFAVTDSFWFNAVEAEVYAMSMLFTVLVVWLALVWRDATRIEEAGFKARGEHPFGLHADRYLVAIAYLFGLAIGVHLLNVLTLFFIALIVFFQKVERDDWTTGQRVRAIVLTGLASAAAFFVIYPGVVQTLPTLAGASGSPLLFVIAVIGLLVAAVVWTQRRGMPVANLVALTITMVMLGYSSYAVIFIRSAADPPIDENDPETSEAIVSYLKREQYGSTPLLSGNNFNPRTGQIDYAREESFPRRYSADPSHLQLYAQYDSDLDFFFRYQLGHMYGRYFMWQFVGKASDKQDAGWISGLRGRGDPPGTTPSEAAGRNIYFGLPLLLGLIGLFLHAQRDWRRALALLVLFLISGVGIILYLNQTPFQPRERDYSYVASFFAFALWIGIGATGLIELATEALRTRAAAMQRVVAVALAAVLFVAVPGWMTIENYDDHDRSGRRIATDFARNMLESTAPNAILFTNGDNDTFPLWYLQEVMGVRRDVRVVNLSLLNTPWYIRQLRDQWSRESAPLPMTLTDEQIDQLQPAAFEAMDVTLPVDPSKLLDETIGRRVNRATLPRQITWRLEGRPLGDGRGVLYNADLAVLDILKAVAEDGWQRPVYFASTVAQDSELGLQAFFQNEGLARRVVPVQRGIGDPDGVVVPEILNARLRNFAFRGLADPAVYHDENARNMADGYRTRFASLAAGMTAAGDTASARALLARVIAEVPAETIPTGFGSLYMLSEAYRLMGDTPRMIAILQQAETFALDQVRRAEGSQSSQQQAAQYIQFVQTAYLLGGAYDEAAAFSQKVGEVLGDPRFARSPAQMRAEGERLQQARDSTDLAP
jgi:MFS family permease